MSNPNRHFLPWLLFSLTFLEFSPLASINGAQTTPFASQYPYSLCRPYPQSVSPSAAMKETSFSKYKEATRSLPCVVVNCHLIWSAFIFAFDRGSKG